MCTNPQIRHLSTISREAQLKPYVKIAILALMWIISFLAPVYGGIRSLYVTPTSPVERQDVIFPLFIQVGFLFGATAITSGFAQIMLRRNFAVFHVSRDQMRTRSLLERAIKTAALQFVSTSCLQV